jgi:hypothetical protein
MGQQRIALHLPGVAAAAGDRAMTLPLERAGFCRLSGDRRGARIRCSRGSLWVTQPGDPLDYVLRAGDGLTVTRRGTILVQALSDAAVQLTPVDHRR